MGVALEKGSTYQTGKYYSAILSSPVDMEVYPIPYKGACRYDFESVWSD